MPEGDTIFRTARALHRALAGRVVTRFESAFPGLTRVHEDTPIVGRTIDSVEPRGKHLLFAFSGDLFLRTHLRMNGLWGIYRPNELWRPSRQRILIATHNAVAVGFSIPVAEFLTARTLARHKQLSTLGPDLAAEQFAPADALERLGTRRDEAIADALLDQRAMAGIGNVFKSEVLFVAGVNPFARTGGLTDDELGRVVNVARRLLRANAWDRPHGEWAGRRRTTTNSLSPQKALWVYGRAGQPCHRCGTTILSRKTGLHARVTYWCPTCQPVEPVGAPKPPD